MKQAFEKILERLEEEREYSYADFEKYVRDYSPCLDSEYDDFFHRGLERAAKLIREVEKEYVSGTNAVRNGWILCSDMMPEEHQMYDITFRNSAGVHSDSAIYNPSLKRWFWDEGETELVESDILAWAEKREPYKERDKHEQ